MVNANKILTVSYGTFSCTLEGFDDSFGTMKAIAEYFRDLAADDRYFGAEPPTPEPEMLARIAEREIARRVEAHRDEGNIVLRADPSSVLPVAPKEPEAPKQDAAPLSAPDQPEPAQAVQPQPQDQHLENPEVEEVQKQDAGQDNTKPEIATDTAPEAEEIDTELSSLQAMLQKNQTAASAEDAVEPVEAPAENGSEEDTAVDVSDVIKDTKTQSADSDPDSIAAKLNRIRAVVSHEVSQQNDSGYSEDEHAVDFLEDAHQDAVELVTTEIEPQTEPSETARSTPEPDSVEALFDMEFSDLEDEADVADVLADESTEHADPSPAINVEDTSDTVEDEDISGLLNRLTNGGSEDGEDGTANAGEDSAEDSNDTTPAVRARVIKMKRADFDAAVSEGSLVASPAEVNPGLSKDDEADLMKELAKVEAELTPKAGEDDGDDTVNLFDDTDDDMDDEPPARKTGGGRARLDTASADSEMNRILAETNNQLDEETGKGRRNAIAHLRAAVAATKAERGAGKDLAPKGPDTEAYRDDLDQVVRPRRPMTAESETRSRRPETQKPAPLKLVAEQRVDVAKDTPVRPRRIQMAAAESVEHDAESFAEFAENAGANGLPDLLEAAAAYLAFVEGREQFSRPQLMTKVRQAEQEEFSREDGLRSFGQLLREGKIVKIKGGRFTASDNISFRPDARYAGE